MSGTKIQFLHTFGEGEGGDRGGEQGDFCKYLAQKRKVEKCGGFFKNYTARL
jgi:hypothetical protein